MVLDSSAKICLSCLHGNGCRIVNACVSTFRCLNQSELPKEKTKRCPIRPTHEPCRRLARLGWWVGGGGGDKDVVLGIWPWEWPLWLVLRRTVGGVAGRPLDGSFSRAGLGHGWGAGSGRQSQGSFRVVLRSGVIGGRSGLSSGLAWSGGVPVQRWVFLQSRGTFRGRFVLVVGWGLSDQSECLSYIRITWWQKLGNGGVW